MDKHEVIELTDFEYTPQGIERLKEMLKTGKTIRNPFAKFYNDIIEVNVIKETTAVAESPCEY